MNYGLLIGLYAHDVFDYPYGRYDHAENRA